MFVPLWIIGLAALAFVLLAMRAFGRRSGGDMIEQQRKATPRAPSPVPPPLAGDADLAPHNPPSAEAALMAIPEVRSALERGRKIEAIRHVREATGMGLKEAKQLVERNWRR